MAVTIKRERPDQRRHHRVTAPLFVSVDGHRLRATDWSLGGLRLDGFPGELPGAGAEKTFQLTLPFQGFDVSFEVKAEVVRTDPAAKMFAVRYTQIGERERELMQHFIEELVRGSMSDVEDTIQRIDVPVTPAKLEPDMKPTAATAAPASSRAPSGKPVSQVRTLRRLPVKAFTMTAIYGVLGFFVFGYAGVLAYTNLFRLEVQTAVITAPVSTVTASSDGEIAWRNVKPGDPVKEGQVVVDVFDHQVERDIELADIAVTEQKAQLAVIKQRIADELDKMKGFANLEIKNVQQTKLELDSLKAQAETAEALAQRQKYLLDKGFTTATLAETAQTSAVAARKLFEAKRIELTSRSELAEANIGTRFYNGTNLIGDLKQLEAQQKLAEYEIQVYQKKREAAEHQRNRIAVVAPFDGTILDLPRQTKTQIRRGDIIATIEQRKDRRILAYLNQDQVNRVGLGDTATIYIPSLGETLGARVKLVDRTTGFTHEEDTRVNPGYSWRGPTDLSAKVTLEFDEPAKVADFEKYRSGLPVVVLFERRGTNSVWASIKRKISMAFQL
jgi:multidrug resistance efflux pump